MSSNRDMDLGGIYRAYIAAIQSKDLNKLSTYVSDEVVHNGTRLGIKGYKDLIERNIIETNVDIEIKRLVADDRTVAAVLTFTTKADTEELVGIRLDGQSFSYIENVFYDFQAGKIVEVFSLVDIDVIRSHTRQSDP